MCCGIRIQILKHCDTIFKGVPPSFLTKFKSLSHFINHSVNHSVISFSHYRIYFRTDMNESISLWNSHLLKVENQHCLVNVKLFDEIAGKVIENKCRKFQFVIRDFMNGFDINIDKLIRKIAIKGQSKPSIFIAVSFDFSH